MRSAELVPVRARRYTCAFLILFHSVIANRSEAERWRLTNEELCPQLASVITTPTESLSR